MANPNWKKGVSGNPSGRKRVVKTIQELARKYTDECVEALVDVLKQGENPARVAAAKVLLAYGYGSPPDSVQITGPDNGPVKHIVEVVYERNWRGGASEA